MASSSCPARPRRRLKHCRSSSTPGSSDGLLPRMKFSAVKQQVAAHWDRRAPHFDKDFGHSIRTPAERAAWDRILDLVLAGRAGLDALDAGCGTGFLSFELPAR